MLSFISSVVCICWPALSVRSCLIRASTSVAANFLVYDRLEVEQKAGVVLSSTVHGRCSGSSTAFSKITDGSLHQHIPLKQWDFSNAPPSSANTTLSGETLMDSACLGCSSKGQKALQIIMAQNSELHQETEHDVCPLFCVSFIVYKLSCLVLRLIAGSSAPELWAGTFLSNDKFISSQRRAKGYVKPG